MFAWRMAHQVDLFIGTQETHGAFCRSEPGRVGPEEPGRHAPARKDMSDVVFPSPNNPLSGLPLVGLGSFAVQMSIAEGIQMENQETAASKKPMNKTEIMAALSEATGLTKQQIAGLFDELAGLIKKNLDEKGPGVFTIPDLLQIKVVRKPATEEHKGINPFTKEEMIVKAKPAKNVVKVVPLKGLKSMV
jgi:nucleoid DNA-binding protein